MDWNLSRHEYSELGGENMRKARDLYVLRFACGREERERDADLKDNVRLVQDRSLYS